MVVVSSGLHVIGQIKVRFPEVEFLGGTSKYKKGTKNPCLRPLQYVPLERFTL